MKRNLTRGVELLVSALLLGATGCDVGEAGTLAKVSEEPYSLEPEWSLEGRYSGVGAAAGKAWVAGASKIFVFDEVGTVVEELPINVWGESVLPTQLDSDAEFEILTFRGWRDVVLAWDHDGRPMWSYEGPGGIDDVATGDLDSDGVDEVCVGYNGSNGLHLLDADGTVRWRYDGIGNVWHVSIGPIFSGSQATGTSGEMGIVTTSSRGDLHRFDADGERMTDFDPGGYSNLVRVARCPGGPIIVASSAGIDKALVGVSLSGDHLWRTSVASRNAHLAEARVSPDGSKIAVVMQRLGVVVLDPSTGRRLASLEFDGRLDIAWLQAGSEELLLVTDQRRVQALRLVARPEVRAEADDSDDSVRD